MSKTILFQWTGFAPREARVDHRIQSSCAAVFPSKAAFLRAIGSKQSRMAYVSYMVIEDGREVGNEGAKMALANPGVVYWCDDLRHTPKDAPWLIHPDPERS